MPEVITVAICCGAMIVLAVLMIPIMGIMTYHKRKMEEIRLRQKSGLADETRAAIESVRREVEALRDTSTQYDVSFDAALHRIESRVGNMEQRMQTVERNQAATKYGAEQENLRAVQ